MASGLGLGDLPPQETAAPTGQWLFKERDLLMGPVPAKVIVDKLYAGDLTGDTPVASEEDELWRPLREVAEFRVHLAKAEARQRVLREKAAVGKPAPDIVGKDLDGVEFKLSDYRGKVVMLDFWGDW